MLICIEVDTRAKLARNVNLAKSARSQESEVRMLFTRIINVTLNIMLQEYFKHMACNDGSA
jgi:hypothetical protein